MAKHKYPGASGKESISDHLVGRQITDGSSQMTNTSFTVEKSIPIKESKKIKSEVFSDFLTLEDLEQKGTDTIETTTNEESKIKFNNDKSNGSVSLFGSLKQRILVAINNIIEKYPSGFFIEYSSPSKTVDYSAYNITYSAEKDNTKFTFSLSTVYNPMGLEIVSENIIKYSDTSFWYYYNRYSLEINGKSFDILKYEYNKSSNEITLEVKGRPFENNTSSLDLLIRPNDRLIEKFYNGLDELESILINRNTTPKFTANFKIPTENEKDGTTGLVDFKATWPISRDGYNIQIIGIYFDEYLTKLVDISDEIDNYKSNLFVRFMTTPQLYEFDSEDRKMEAAIQIYGQSFDKVKKFINNIAYMRNVSYDKVNNIPDLLLKNLSVTLGLDPVKLINEKDINFLLYDKNYSVNNEDETYNPLETEIELYRRILINLAYLYKSKGTRKSIEFFLKFIGAPEQLIKIDEYVYKVKNVPLVDNLEDKIYNVIEGIDSTPIIKFNGLTGLYEVSYDEGKVNYKREDYPVKFGTNLPKYGRSKKDNIFFQKGSGWYEKTLQHKSETIIDNDLSDYSGRIKTIVTKDKEFSYGEEYFDIFRTLPGLDFGFDLEGVVDNKKTHVTNNELILNRKNININLSPTNLIDYDIYTKSNQLELSFGQLPSQEERSFSEFLNMTLSEVIKNSHTYRYDKRYYSLEKIYEDYLNSTDFIPYSLGKINDFTNEIGPHWTKLIEQFIPSSTLWSGGNLIENSFLSREKFQFKKPCIELQFLENLYPEFVDNITKSFYDIVGEDENIRQLVKIQNVKFYPEIEIDGVLYSGDGTTTDINGNIIDTFFPYEITVSGNTTNVNGVRLYENDYSDECYVGPNLEGELPLICGYDENIYVDIKTLKKRWKGLLINFIDGIVNAERENITYEFIIDENGIEQVIFTGVKYDNFDCTINEYLNFKFKMETNIVKEPQTLEVEFSTRCDNNGEKEYILGSEENCNLKTNIRVDLVNRTIPLNEGQKDRIKYPLVIYKKCNDEVSYSHFLVDNEERGTLENGGCYFMINDVGEYDSFDLIMVDNANTSLNVRVDGLQIQYVSPESYKIQPKIEYRQTQDYGFFGENRMVVIEDGSVKLKTVRELEIGDRVINPSTKLPHQYNINQLINGINGNDVSFIFDDKMINTITKKDCIGTIRRMELEFGDREVIHTLLLLQNDNVFCYFKKDDGEYDFQFKHPSELKKTYTIEKNCCGLTETEVIYGDYIVTRDGNLLPFLNYTLDICEPSLYFHLNFDEKSLNEYENFYIGNENEQIVIKNKIQEINDFDFNIETIEISGNCCPDGITHPIREPKEEFCNLDGSIYRNTCE